MGEKVGWGAYVELVEELIECYLPLVDSCAPVHHVVAHYDLDYY
jgi:hypothetical protein